MNRLTPSTGVIMAISFGSELRTMIGSIATAVNRKRRDLQAVLLFVNQTTEMMATTTPTMTGPVKTSSILPGYEVQETGLSLPALKFRHEVHSRDLGPPLLRIFKGRTVILTRVIGPDVTVEDMCAFMHDGLRLVKRGQCRVVEDRDLTSFGERQPRQPPSEEF